MKIKVFLILAIAALAACGPNEPISYYGEKISADQALTTPEFVLEMKNQDSASVKMEGKIIETCTKKGCWMTLDLGNGEVMRVTFKDYGFFVPTEGVEGKTVVIDGLARKTTTDVETLRHYAEDAGKSDEEIAAINAPQKELTFVAIGAAIKGHQE